MDMFQNYNNLPTSYIPNNQDCYMNDNRLPHKPMGVYDSMNRLIGYSWVYGDGITLEFTVQGTVSDDITLKYTWASDFLTGKTVVFNLFNNRHDIVMSKQILCTSNVITITIQAEESTYIPRDVYTCELYVEETSQNERITLFNESNGSLYVK